MTRRALIVDDEPALRLLLKLTLVDWQADELTRGDEALAALTDNPSHPYEIILLDVMLPGLDGWSLAKELVDAGHETPIVFLTAYGPQSGEIKSELGLALLPKPFDSQLLQNLAKTLTPNSDQAGRKEQISSWQETY